MNTMSYLVISLTGTSDDWWWFVPVIVVPQPPVYVSVVRAPETYHYMFTLFVKVTLDSRTKKSLKFMKQQRLVVLVLLNLFHD